MIIGLTGGIATGKTSIAKTLAKRGALVIDADELAHRAMEPGREANRKIAKNFPTAVRSDGTIDRRKLGQLVFDHPDLRARLERIVHPEVLRMIQEELAANRGRWVVLMVPLLFETGMEKLVDEVWVVKASPAEQRERLMRRNAFSREEAEQRIKAQWPMERKVALADVVIDNDLPPAEVEENLARLLVAKGLVEAK